MPVILIENETLGFRFLLIGFMMFVFLLIRRQWRSASVRREEVIRLIALATEESYVLESEIRAVTEEKPYVSEVRAKDHGSASSIVVYRCAVCNYPTNTRCAQCKSVHYCSSNCQILHWRRGHKEECKPPSLVSEEEENSIESDDAKGSHIEFGSLSESEDDRLSNNGDVFTSKVSVQKVEERFSTIIYEKTRQKTRNRVENVESSRMYSNGVSVDDVVACDQKVEERSESLDLTRNRAENIDAKPRKTGNKNSRKSGDSVEMLIENEGEVNALGQAMDFINKKDSFYEIMRPVSRKKTRNLTENIESSTRMYSNDKSTDAKPQSYQNSRRSGEMVIENEGEVNALGHGRTTYETSSSVPAAMSSLPPKAYSSKPNVSEASSSGLNGLSVDVSRSKPSVQKVEERSEAMEFFGFLNKKDSFYETTRPLSRKKTRNLTEKVESSSSRTYSSVKNIEGEVKTLRHERTTCEPFGVSATMSKAYSSKPKVSQASSSGLKTSVQKVVQRFKPPKSSNLPQPSSSVHEMSFSYEMFVKLYCDRVELQPFGLVNIGNSCYANAVLQCLAFTRPLTSYLIRGLHSKACRKKSWCLVCEFEYLILRARGGESPLSPIKILSRLQKIGNHLGPGKEEDAHEFLRCAVDTMQSVLLKEVDATTTPFVEENTLIGLTFGGYLHSKIKCMKCFYKSERSELMMDLTVEIDGDIGSLEEALAQFTAYEVLDGENRYFCSKCKSYQKAKKKLMILQGPNILTVVLKRFQSHNFGKLSKPIHFPEVLDISPYLSSRPDHNDSHPVYSLYAVVVHLDAMSSSYSGHYVCYTKTLRGDWFKIDDSNVFPVRLETVLLQGAYMLLYARDSPRPVGKNNNFGRKPRERTTNLTAIPASHGHDDAKKKKILWLPRVDSSSGSLSSMFSSSDTTSSCSTKDSPDSQDSSIIHNQF